MSEKAKGGRPRADEPGTTVCAWVKASEHDKLIALANRRGESVSELVASLVRQVVKRDGSAA